MKAKTKTIFIASLAVLDFVFGGLIVSNSINSSRVKDADIKATANYVVVQHIDSISEDVIDSVKDKEAPVITGVKNIEIYAGEKVDFFKDIVITDNSGQEIEKNVTGTYDINKVGEYTLVYEAKDTSDNISKEEFKLIVKAAPKINGVKNITTTVGTKVDLLKNISVTGLKGKVNTKVIGSYDINKVGTYTLSYQATDETGKTITSNKFNLVVNKKATSTVNNTYKGKKLTKSAGAIQGPSGKETYYNLNMAGCVRIMRRLGYSEAKYPYWVRSDGVKMFGDYVMVAASLDIRPKGTLVQTSLGMGIVVDTGTFAKKNKTQLDIAVAW